MLTWTRGKLLTLSQPFPSASLCHLPMPLPTSSCHPPRGIISHVSWPKLPVFHLGCYTYGLSDLPLSQWNNFFRRKYRIEVLHKSVHGISSLGAKHSYYMSRTRATSTVLAVSLSCFLLHLESARELKLHTAFRALCFSNFSFLILMFFKTTIKRKKPTTAKNMLIAPTALFPAKDPMYQAS